MILLSSCIFIFSTTIVVMEYENMNSHLDYLLYGCTSSEATQQMPVEL